ncbi:heat shock protein HSP70 family protein [Ceratobasidium sp. AG-Ba]|nr:heat shock protein HSP70 family protein [Ceratobasidium sp. AG-Ba]
MLPLALLGLALASRALASILAIDYGADTMKVALMKPGVPFEVVLDNRIVGIWPHGFLKTFLEGSKHFSSAFTQTFRGMFVGKRPNDNQYTLEEVVPMQLRYVKDLPGQVPGENVRDVVVAIPAYVNRFQRQAVIDATKIVGLDLLALVDDETARAYTKKLHIIYDSSASSTRVTLVLLETKLITTGYRHTSSSSEPSCRLNKILLDILPASLKNGLIDRNYAKHAREAERVSKAILSMNADVITGVEGLVEERDWKGKIERRVYGKRTRGSVPEII